MKERNSEGKKTWLVIAGSALQILFFVLDQVLQWGVIPQEHAAFGMLGGLLTAAASVGIYANGRTKKKVAETNAAGDVASTLAYEKVKAANPPSPAGPQ